MTDWVVVVPFKGTEEVKSRLATRFQSDDRIDLAFAFLADTVTAALAVDSVTHLLIVSSDLTIARRLIAAVPNDNASISVVSDPGRGLNSAVLAGIANVRRIKRDSGVAVLTGDLAVLHPADLADALSLAAAASAEGHPLSFVPDRKGSGTTMIALAAGQDAKPRFGRQSCAAHTAAGYLPLEVAQESSLRLDIDGVADLEAAYFYGLGKATTDLLDRMAWPG